MIDGKRIANILQSTTPLIFVHARNEMKQAACAVSVCAKKNLICSGEASFLYDFPLKNKFIPNLISLTLPKCILKRNQCILESKIFNQMDVYGTRYTERSAE